MKNKNKIKTVTVGVCTKNRQQLCLRVVKSLLSQSRLPNEIIIVDNSVDKPFYLKNDLLTELHHKKIKIFKIKGKLGKLRNFIIQNSNSDIISFIDDDAIADFRWIEKIVETFNNNPDISAISGFIKSSNISVSATFSENLLQFYLKNKNKSKQIVVAPALNLSILKEKIVNKSIKFDENLNCGEDTDFTISLFKNKFKLLYVPEVLVSHEYRTSLIAFVLRTYEYAFNDFKISKRHNFYFDFNDYLPYSFSIKSFFFAPILFPKKFLKRVANMYTIMNKRFLSHIIARELALFLGFYISFIVDILTNSNKPLNSKLNKIK